MVAVVGVVVAVVGVVVAVVVVVPVGKSEYPLVVAEGVTKVVVVGSGGIVASTSPREKARMASFCLSIISVVYLILSTHVDHLL